MKYGLASSTLAVSSLGRAQISLQTPLFKAWIIGYVEQSREPDQRPATKPIRYEERSTKD